MIGKKIDIFSGITAVVCIPALIYLMIYSQNPIIGILGWIFCLAWVVVGNSLCQKLCLIRERAEKASIQNNEFAGSLITTLKTQSHEIQDLQEEKLFLMMSLDKYSRGENEKN